MANIASFLKKKPEEKSDDVKYWLAQIDSAQKWRNSYYEKGKKVISKYAGSDPDDILPASHSYEVNTLWSNTETIKPALYAKTPQPDVVRRFRDKDPVGKWCAIVLERSLEYQTDAYDFDGAIRECVHDYLLPGQGQIWVQYEPAFSGDGETKQIEWERCCNKHLHWKDFLYSPARSWDEVWWVAQRAYFTREEIEKNPRWGKKIADKLTFEDAKTGEEKVDETKKAQVWEIWCKSTGFVYFVSKNCPVLLEEARNPFLNFDGFYPCPRPLTTTVTPDKYLPQADYLQYQNQAHEIDTLSQRIGLMCEALRVVGIYDAGQDALGRLLDRKGVNEMVPCSSWAVLAQGGGLKAAVEFFPIDQIVTALKQAYESREAAKQMMYEITGLGDIIRGASNPNETATAQQIKSQWGGLRIRDRQKEVQRFVRDVLRLDAEIIAEQFQPSTLKLMSNVPLYTMAEKRQLQQRKEFIARAEQMAQQNPQLAQQFAEANPQIMAQLNPLTLDEEQMLREPAWEEVVQLLKDERLRCYRIDIETDSTIQSDEMEEKQQRSEFLGATTQFLTAVGPIALQMPKLVPLFAEMLKWGARGFKAADTLEAAIDEAMDYLSQQALAPKPLAPPDPKIAADREKTQADMVKQDKDHALEREKMQHEAGMQMNQQQHEIRMQMNEGAMTAERENVKNAALKPRQEDVATALAPLIEAVQQGMAVVTDHSAKSQQATQESLVQLSGAVKQAIETMIQIASAPKKITLERGANGRVAGGTARPVLQ